MRRFARRRVVVATSLVVAFFLVIPAAFVLLGPSDMTSARGVRTSWVPPTHTPRVSVVNTGAPAADFRLEGQTLIATVDGLGASTRTKTVALLDHPAPLTAAAPPPRKPSGSGDEGDGGD
jgi:hypothetical protein